MLPMAQLHESTLTLQAAPPRFSDLGSNVVRLPRSAMDILGVDEGDPVRIEGSSDLWARALSAHPEDEEIAAVRIDATVDKCPEIVTGRSVRVHVAPIRRARELDVSTDSASHPSPQAIREALASTPIVLRGDQIRLDLENETADFDIEWGLAGVSLRHLGGRRVMMEGTLLKVVFTVPDGPVRLASDTRIRLRP